MHFPTSRHCEMYYKIKVLMSIIIKNLFFLKYFTVYSCWEVLLIFEIFSLLHWAKWVQFSFNCFKHHVRENMTECKLLRQDVRGRKSCWIYWHLSVSWKHETYYFFNNRSGRNACLPVFKVMHAFSLVLGCNARQGTKGFMVIVCWLCTVHS